LTSEVAQALAASLPVKDDDCKSDWISLVDLAVVGIEISQAHFRVQHYNPDADGLNEPWAILLPLDSSRQSGLPKAIYASTVRNAAAAYLDSRLRTGLSLGEARKLIDGSYTDAEVAGSILQFALYGEEVY